MLDLLFSGRWEDRVDRDKDGYAFFDYDPDLFSIILRYLSALHTYGMVHIYCYYSLTLILINLLVLV